MELQGDDIRFTPPERRSRPLWVAIYLLLALAGAALDWGLLSGAVPRPQLFAPTPTPTRSALSWAEEGKAQFMAGDLDAAIQAYQMAARLAPRTVGEDRPGNFKPDRHEHGRPYQGVEAVYLLPYEVNVGWPVLLEFITISAVSERGYVVYQGVHPDVYDVVLIAGERDPPLEGRPSYGDVLQALLEDLQHLVLSEGGLDEIRPFFKEPL